MTNITLLGFVGTRLRVESAAAYGADKRTGGWDTRLVAPMPPIHNSTGVSATGRRRS